MGEIHTGVGSGALVFVAIGLTASASLAIGFLAYAMARRARAPRSPAFSPLVRAVVTIGASARSTA